MSTPKKLFKTAHLYLSVLLLAVAGCSVNNNVLVLDAYEYTGTYLDISNETFNARTNFWHPEGTMIFVTGRDTENVASYSVSEPWNLGSASFFKDFDLSNEFGSTSQDSRAHGLFFKADGEKMWVFNRTELWGYTLATAWDVSTASQSYYAELSDFVQRGHDFYFTPDGIRLFIDDRNAEAIHEVRLSTPWDITTFEWVYTLDISEQENAVRGIVFQNEGSLMYLMDTGRKEILRYELAEAYNLKTAVYVDAIDVSAQSSDPRGLSVRPDLEYLYVTGRDKEKIFQYKRTAASKRSDF